jgi:diguanylate cyclase (GGDEF)-like protein
MLSNGKESTHFKKSDHFFGFQRVFEMINLSRTSLNENEYKRLVIFKLVIFFSIIASIIVVDSLNYYASIARQINVSRGVVIFIDKARDNQSNNSQLTIRSKGQQGDSEFRQPLWSGTVSNPAYVGIELDSDVSDPYNKIWMYSNDPFAQGKDVSVAINKQEKTALALLAENSVGEYYEVVGNTLFYAMTVSIDDKPCVTCDKQLPSSTKTDWKVGDTRSVIAIRSDLNFHRTDTMYITSFFLLSICFFLIYLYVNMTKKLNVSVKESHLDSLTKLYNRKYIDQILKKTFDKRSGHKGDYKGIGVCILDIDNFKQINDDYGHAKGDECLQKLAEIIFSHVRNQGDIAARWGGEEFLIMLDNVSAVECKDVIDRMLKDFSHLVLEEVDQVFSFSAGITHIASGKHLYFDKAFKIADKKMYYAKNNGKSQVCLSSVT